MAQQVVIVGGGVMGAATARFLARGHGCAVTVLEQDLGFTQASSALSASSIRQQFSQPVNLRLSRWSLQFLQTARDGDPASTLASRLGLVLPGYLYLAARDGTAAQALRENQRTQQAEGADVRLLEPAALRERFPWLNVDDLALGAWGAQGEGWFDGPALHQALRREAQAHGARFVQARACRWHTQGTRVQAVETADGSRFGADRFVLCAGAWTAPLAATLGVTLPVVGKRRDVFVFESPASLPGCPLVIDPSGLWFRPEGGRFLCGAPPRDGDADDSPLDRLDHGQFDEQLWPILADRVPSFEAVRLRSAWAGWYEMNTWDHNGLAGALPGWDNAFTACGFSGHGMQQAPAVGCALAALVAQAEPAAPAGLPPAPDIAELAPDRVLTGRRLLERNVI